MNYATRYSLIQHNLLLLM